MRLLFQRDVSSVLDELIMKLNSSVCGVTGQDGIGTGVVGTTSEEVC